MNKLLFCFLLFSISLLTSHISLAQNPEANRANIWYFGNGAGLDFSSGSPVAITNGALHAKEGCSSICDLNGNLLFYTDGDTVWNRNHNPMPNGTGLGSWDCAVGVDNSGLQGALIVPHPGNPNQYYIFTTGCIEDLGADGYRYSLVDMTLDGGFGDVVVSQKRVLLYAPGVEGLTATQHANGRDYWIITHEQDNNVFRVFLIDPSGINTTPIIQYVGMPMVPGYYGVSLEISPDKSKLALTFCNLYDPLGLLEILNFDANTGMLSHFVFLKGCSYWSAFSSNSQKVYYTISGNHLFSFTLCYKDTIEIQNSYDSIVPYSWYFPNTTFGDIQLANNGEIYIAYYYGDSISYIDNINHYSPNFYLKSVFLGGKISRDNMPNLMNFAFAVDENTCIVENELFIPNVFSPNGDEANDLFSIEGLQQEDEVCIYNRWGTKVYEFVNTEDAWDGHTTAGEKCSEGIYYYYIKRKNAENKKGFIHLFY
jgi:gliding motility-associated-like protein